MEKITKSLRHKKAIPRGKIIILIAFITKFEKQKTIDNDIHAQTKPKSSRWEEIIKNRDEINELEIKAKTIQRIYKRKHKPD